MTTTQTTKSPRRAAQHAATADQSQAAADAYRALADLIKTDDRFAVLREMELDRMLEQADEYGGDAEEERERAFALGYWPA